MRRTSLTVQESQAVQAPIDGSVLHGNLTLPPDCTGLVVFAHGSGSSRHSPRNRAVAKSLQEEQIATLLIDLLTEDEEEEERLSRHLRFDIDLLAHRLTSITDWLTDHPMSQGLSLGYFGASTGGAAALVAAAWRPNEVDAVVSRGGRPDLAGDYLPKVQAPTLLIVGGNDIAVARLNEEALTELASAREKKILVVPGATHLFEEAGSLESVARFAIEWFKRHLIDAKRMVQGDGI